MGQQNQDSEAGATWLSNGLVQVVWTVGIMTMVILGGLVLIVGYFILFVGTYFCGSFTCCFSCFENSPFKDVDVGDIASKSHSILWDLVLSGETFLLVGTASIASGAAVVGVLLALSADRDKLGEAGALLGVHLVIVGVLYALGAFPYAAHGWEMWSEFISALASDLAK